MQNMKLLDLQTGKYLELFKDYAYCGNAILFHGFDDDCLPTFTNGFENMINQDWACCGEICYKTEPQEPLKTLCEKTGAVVYGGRYVLLNGFTVPKSNRYDKDHYFIGDVASVCVNCHSDADDYRLMILSQCDSTLLKWYEVHKFKKQGHYCIVSEIDTDYSDSFYNVFEEYSKQFRNEPNKFEELINLYI